MTSLFTRQLRSRLGDGALVISTGAATLLVLIILAVILVDVVRNGVPRLSLAFLTEAPREGMTAGGIFPAIFGTARDGDPDDHRGRAGRASRRPSTCTSTPPRRRALTRAIRIAVTNLAGVPSIVFGLFGLGFFVQFVGAGIDKPFFGGEKVFGQPALIWAALTMAVLTLPVVIVATEEALRAVPRELREASLALGATKFQTVLNVVLPQASARAS